MNRLASPPFPVDARARHVRPVSRSAVGRWLAASALGAILIANACADEITVKLVHGVDYQPFSFGIQDAPEGLLPRIAEAVFSKCPGIRLEQSIYPWNRAQYLVEKGDANAIITVPTDGRLKYLRPSATPVISPHFFPYASVKNGRIAELRDASVLADFQKFRVGAYSGSGWSREHLQGFDVDYTTSLPSQVFPMLALDRFDVVFENSIVADYMIRKASLQDNIKPLTAAAVGRYEWHLLVRKDLQGADAVLNCFERQITPLRKSPRWGAIWQAVGVDPSAE